ncbi:MAG: DUF169 domain-containing protein [Oscillospiraceae bacterium]|nr:DUF169 domain-containing protein [Oscillospiraceae bacterium]MBR5260722.1 DUF169 domain-containing protein [Oscillospiraceae bacterium]
MKNVNLERQQLLDKLLRLNNPAVALKFIEDEKDVPENALRPYRDKQRHYSICQAFALARRENRTVFMTKDDEWCWNPMITYGLVECKRGTPEFDLLASYMGIKDKEKAADFVDNFPKLPYGKYKGTLIAPLCDADFEPDVTLIYCLSGQLRFMLMGIYFMTGELLDSSFTPLDSCVWSVVPPFLEGKYRITLPDPGEFERALTEDHEIIFTVPYQKMDEFMQGMQHMDGRNMTVRSYQHMMQPDYGRPPFYNTLFEAWGQQTGPVWDK